MYDLLLFLLVPFLLHVSSINELEKKMRVVKKVQG